MQRSATTTTRGRDDGDGDDDDDDDAMDVATDDDEAMKMPFNAPTLTLRRTRVGSRTTRARRTGRLAKSRRTREDETRGRDETRARRGVQRASDGNLTTEIDRDDDRNDAASTERGVRARSSRRRGAPTKTRTTTTTKTFGTPSLDERFAHSSRSSPIAHHQVLARVYARFLRRVVDTERRRRRGATTSPRDSRPKRSLRAVPRSVRRTSTSSRRSRRRRRRCDHRRCFRR